MLEYRCKYILYPIFPQSTRKRIHFKDKTHTLVARNFTQYSTEKYFAYSIMYSAVIDTKQSLISRQELNNLLTEIILVVIFMSK